jgi:hypothetical protein
MLAGGELRAGAPSITVGQTYGWYGAGKIYLLWRNGDKGDFPIDMNDDGTPDMTYGELKKQGS